MREAILGVIGGFGENRRARAPELLALQAFIDVCGGKERRQEGRAPPPLAPDPAPAPPVLRRLELKIKSLPTQPTTIDLTAYSELGDAGAKRLVEALYGHQALKELRLPRTRLGHAGASYVSSSLPIHPP